ncbi:MAG: bifunctional riboflavin kinase/FAD synthetase [Planctomycetota bacterium]|nr:bifunctional riboflavin kinase/FAD synthetase [Planctomycetota bacterium]
MIASYERDGRFPTAPNGAVVSVGVFDGVHLGHQEILRRNVETARALGARSTVVTFRQHPKSVLLGRAPRTLTSLEHRLELFRRAGIEHAVALTFDEALRAIPAADFAREFLAGSLHARRLVLGFDSKFGRGREGTPEFLAALGLSVDVVGQVVLGGRPVSSTAIREAVELGDLEAAAAMLGRPVAVHGEVVAGDKLGRRIGFPTANLDLHHELHPPTGVYAVRVRVVRYGQEARIGPELSGVANIGFRPTIEGARPETPRIEVHLLDFDGDLYGEHVELEFVAWLRPEQRFDGLPALQAQIARDVLAARATLERGRGGAGGRHPRDPMKDARGGRP